MRDPAYRYMDWPAIEALVYGECDDPRTLMKPRKVKEGILYQCFFPDAEKVYLLEESGKKHLMKKEDDAGYFALILKGREAEPHSFLVDGKEAGDSAAFDPFIPESVLKRFADGSEMEAYRYMGASVRTLDGVPGVSFAVWAPNAARVSVVGDFNGWDGRANPMNRLPEYGIFELFIPGLPEGSAYKYELRLKDGLVYMRPDPYARFEKADELSVSKLFTSSFKWADAGYQKAEKQIRDRSMLPVCIFECGIGEAASARGVDPTEAYRGLAELLPEELSEKGYTHLELKPVAEYANTESEGYHTTSFFAPSSRFGTPDELKLLVDRMHAAGIGVILDWNASQFSQDTDYLSYFDGTALYEHLDERLGTHPVWGTKLFNYGRSEVKNFLLSNAFYWLKEFHIDGLRIPGCETMLRRDYARAGGNFVPNMMGGGENLEGQSLLRELSVMKSRYFPGALLILEQGIFQPDVTTPAEDGGLGFDFEWNLHFTTDLKRYLSLDAEGRRADYALLGNGMLGNYFHKAVISLSRGMGRFERGSLVKGISGGEKEAEELLRAAYVYLFTHPGKKLLTDGEDADGVFLPALLRLYREDPALFEEDYLEEGFEWVRSFDGERAMIAFARESAEEKDYLLCVFNFSDESLARTSVGVPYAGRYKEIFNSDAAEFGGTGFVNPRARAAREEECDERSHALYLRIAARSAAVFRYQG